MDLSSPFVAVVILLVWITLVFFLAYRCGCFNNKSFRFGPAPPGEKPIEILGIKIDTKRKVMWVMLYAFLSTLMSEYGANIIDPWITNIVQDPKSALPMPKLWIMLIHNGYNIFGWMNYILQIMMVLPHFLWLPKKVTLIFAS